MTCDLCGAECRVLFEHDTHAAAHCVACLDRCMPSWPRARRRTVRPVVARRVTPIDGYERHQRRRARS